MLVTTRNRKHNGRKHIAFVASGGGPKALFWHIGFSKALQDHGIKLADIKTFVGSSAGSIFAALASSGYTLDEMVNSFTEGNGSLKRPGYLNLIGFNHSIIKDWLSGVRDNNFTYNGIENVPFNLLRISGIFSTNGIERYIKDVLISNDFKKLDHDLFVTGTRLNPTREIYKDIFCGKDFYNERRETKYRSDVSVSNAVAASCALPPLFAPRRIKTEKETIDFIDGEVRNTLSTHVAEDNGADLVLVSYTHEPYHFTDKIGSLKKYGLYPIIVQSIFISISQKIRNAMSAREANKIAIDTVYEFSESRNLPKNLADDLVEMLCARLNFNPDCKYMMSSPKDPLFFRQPNFNLSKDCASKIIDLAYKQGLEDLAGLDYRPSKIYLIKKAA